MSPNAYLTRTHKSSRVKYFPGISAEKFGLYASNHRQGDENEPTLEETSVPLKGVFDAEKRMNAYAL